MEETTQATAIVMIGLPFHALISYYFVHSLDLGVLGLAVAIDITYACFLFVITTYCCFTKNEKIRGAWTAPDRESLEGWTQILSLGLPGVFIYVIDWGSFEMIALMSGLLGVVELSTMGIILILNQIFTATAYGMQFASTIYVGNSIGAQNV